MILVLIKKRIGRSIIDHDRKLGRMLQGGADPLFVVRRILRMSSEDIGMADPRSLEHVEKALLRDPNNPTALALRDLATRAAPRSIPS